MAYSTPPSMCLPLFPLPSSLFYLPAPPFFPLFSSRPCLPSSLASYLFACFLPLFHPLPPSLTLPSYGFPHHVLPHITPHTSLLTPPPTPPPPPLQSHRDAGSCHRLSHSTYHSNRTRGHGVIQRQASQ